MSILSKLFSRILDPGRKVGEMIEQSTPIAPRQQQQSMAGASTPQSAPGSSGQPAQPIDIEKNLDQLARAQSQTLDWRHSIVDLMKLVGMDSTLAERKELAKELGYTGDTADSAKMNLWLHAEVMRKLAENGGKVPASMLN